MDNPRIGQIEGLQAALDGKGANLSGSGVPGAGLGNDGDLYIDDLTGQYYTKSGGAWTLQGPTGGNGIFDASNDGGVVPTGFDIGLTDKVNFDSNTLVIDGTNNNVGIGTANPDNFYKLDVDNGLVGNALKLSAINGHLRLFETDGSDLSYFTQIERNFDSFHIYQNDGVGYTHVLSALMDGKVGLGTTLPSEKLHVVGSMRMVDGNEASGLVMTSDVNGVARWATAPGAGGSPSLRNVSATDTFVTAQETINCTANTFTVNLPTAVGIQGTVYTLVNSGTGIITLDPNGTETINGSLTIDLAQYVSRTVQSDGTNWIII